jgi:tryptophanyl-tRNA synthetase
LENKGKVFLNEPQLMPSPPIKILGLDGHQMSYQANNTINLRDAPEVVSSKIRSMTTDPARIRKTDRGNPESCPVWTLHQIYSNDEVKSWAELGCLSAGIGCLDCKAPLIDAINLQQNELIENAKPYQDEPTLVKRIITDGCLRARDIASDNLKQIKLAMNLEY